MNFLTVLGAVSGVLGGLAVLLSSLTGRSTSKDTGAREDRRLGLEELNDALIAQRERIDEDRAQIKDLRERVTVAEAKVQQCEDREAVVRSQLNTLLIEIAKEHPR